MNRIHLRQTLPQVFADRDAITSDVWHRDITFHKGKRYLIEAASGTGNHRFAAMFTATATIIRESSTLMSAISVHSPSMTGQIYANTPSAFFSGVAYLSRTYRHRKHTTEEPAYQLQKRKEVLTLFEAIGIADKVNEKAGKLSFGQQQRVAFIRSLCQPFDFIFLDEPVSHLDDENGTIMGRLLTEEASRQGAGIIVTSIGKHLELDYDEIYQL